MPTAQAANPLAARQDKLVNGIVRGMRLIEVLAVLRRARLTKLAKEARLPLSTAHRLLSTFQVLGYVTRDEDDNFVLTSSFLGLAQAVEGERWVTEVAKPRLDALGRNITWPLSLVKPLGAMMVVCATTDYRSPLALLQFGAGFKVPMLASAGGRFYLAFCDSRQQAMLLELLATSSNAYDRVARSPRRIERILGDIRAAGHAVVSPGVDGASSVAVPIMVSGAIFGSLVARHYAAEMPEAQLQRDVLPKLKEEALALGEALAGFGL